MHNESWHYTKSNQLYIYSSKGIIFVVDSNDRERIEEAREELFSLLDEQDLRNCVLLVLANKQVSLN